MVFSDDMVFPPVRATTAWVLFGLCFALLFYGVVLCQGHSYFRTYREDPLDLKLTVAAILLANAANLGLIMYTWSLVLTPISIFLCILLCEYVYIRRTYLVIPQISRWIFVALAVLFVSSAATFITILTVQIAKQPTFQQWLEFKWLVSASFGCSVLGDLGLACILSLALHVSRTGLKRTDALLNSIIINAFRSGIVTRYCPSDRQVSLVSLTPVYSMLSILCLLVAVFEGTNVVIIPLSLAVAKIYANATLVTLNIRRDMSEMLTAPGGSELLSLSFFRTCAPRQSERSEGNTYAPGCHGSILGSEV
ncbi:hypothetical protein LXA43DRAFT_1092929 [Ganoderma leucocontextum]|nr:hypothetical protein LXA43DRAFT_1092929 [Ganoderma leucocontextum]